MPGLADLLRPYMESFAAQGIGANEALRRCQAVGMGARRTDFLRIYREYTEFISKQPAWGSIRKDYYASQHLYTPSRKRMLNTFTYKVEVRFFDTRIQAIGALPVNVGSNTQRTIRDIEDEAFKVFQRANVEQYMQFISSVVSGGLVGPNVVW